MASSSTDGRTTGKAVGAPDAELNGTKTTLFSVIAASPVRGPLTMWAQSEVITRHQLDRTEGLRYAEMPRLIEQVDPETGEVVIGEDGEPVMVSNDVRLSWIDATALTTVLGLGIISYAFSASAMVVGLAPWGWAGSCSSCAGPRIRRADTTGVKSGVRGGTRGFTSRGCRATSALGVK